MKTLILCALLCAPFSSHAFDCGNQKSKIEKLVCNDTKLKILNEKLNSTYLEAIKFNGLKSPAAQNGTKSRQEEWAESVEKDCSDKICIQERLEKQQTHLELSSKILNQQNFSNGTLLLLSHPNNENVFANFIYTFFWKKKNGIILYLGEAEGSADQSPRFSEHDGLLTASYHYSDKEDFSGRNEIAIFTSQEKPILFVDNESRTFTRGGKQAEDPYEVEDIIVEQSFYPNYDDDADECLFPLKKPAVLHPKLVGIGFDKASYKFAKPIDVPCNKTYRPPSSMEHYFLNIVTQIKVKGFESNPPTVKLEVISEEPKTRKPHSTFVNYKVVSQEFVAP